MMNMLLLSNVRLQKAQQLRSVQFCMSTAIENSRPDSSHKYHATLQILSSLLADGEHGYTKVKL